MYIALIHYPVLDKNNDVIASAVTNLDLHDIARVAKTYGVKAFYVVTPLYDQAALIAKIIGHWVGGIGSRLNPTRRQALELVRVSSSYREVVDEISAFESCLPKTVTTTARSCFDCESYTHLRNRIIDCCEPHILTFGTAWGLTDGFLEKADYILESIAGVDSYNHLSVRSAVSITLDRLLRY